MSVPSTILGTTSDRMKWDRTIDVIIVGSGLAAAKPLAEAPFYAARVWPKIHHTMGGVEINGNAEVIDLDGLVIPGLFAAGEVTGGIHGACRLGSVAIIDCLVFGRVAGKNVASGVATHAAAA